WRGMLARSTIALLRLGRECGLKAVRPTCYAGARQFLGWSSTLGSRFCGDDERRPIFPTAVALGPHGWHRPIAAVKPGGGLGERRWPFVSRRRRSMRQEIAV